MGYTTALHPSYRLIWNIKHFIRREVIIRFVSEVWESSIFNNDITTLSFYYSWQYILINQKLLRLMNEDNYAYIHLYHFMYDFLYWIKSIKVHCNARLTKSKWIYSLPTQAHMHTHPTSHAQWSLISKKEDKSIANFDYIISLTNHY